MAEGSPRRDVHVTSDAAAASTFQPTPGRCHPHGTPAGRLGTIERTGALQIADNRTERAPDHSAMIDLKLQRHAFLALAAAALFGVSTPLAKLLLGELPPGNRK